MSRVVRFIKSEAVMLISFLLSAVSMIFVAPNEGYVDYIDFRTLALLFCLMAVMAGFNRLGVFRLLAEKLLSKTKTTFGVIFALILLCFFSSMIITNDVALITFVPFTIVTLKLAGQSKKLIFTVTLETVAANLGSMLTPIGNPQNLYLFSKYDMSIAGFLKTIFPYAALSLAMLIIFSLFSKKEKINHPQNTRKSQIKRINVKLIIIYCLLFALSLLCVFRVFDNYVILLLVVAAAVLIFDRKTLAKIDYSLLLTFVFLFIFIGNLGNLPSINEWLSGTVNGNEVITGIAVSQVFSNVPAAILLSGFTLNANDLLIGVNLGGLGTLIASMASLISFKFIQKENVPAVKYLIFFTVVNVAFLAANICLWLIK